MLYIIAYFYISTFAFKLIVRIVHFLFWFFPYSDLIIMLLYVFCMFFFLSIIPGKVMERNNIVLSDDDCSD
jgi:hypothetical protein